MKNITFIALLLSFLFCFNYQLLSQKAFPEAEGAGAFAVGGRNGNIYHVTNLNSNGPGSLSDAVSDSNRIIVFNVSGIIDMNQGILNIAGNNLTIAGQTAPGDGIWIKNAHTIISGSEIIMRNLRFSHGYWGPSEHSDVIGFGKSVDQIILDHISVYWGTDETVSPYNEIDNITIQYSLMAEGLNYLDPTNSPPRHGFGGIVGSLTGGTVTMHHSLWAHFSKRCPRISGDKDGLTTCLIDYRNNVTYNCSENTGHNNKGTKVNINFTGCYLKYGPSTPEWLKYSIFQPQSNFLRMYLDKNFIWQDSTLTEDNWLSCKWDGTDYESEVRVNNPFDAPEVQTDDALVAYEKVIGSSGALLPARSVNDKRIVEDVMEGKGSIVDYETDLPEAYYDAEFYSIDTPADTDNDGMPDFWEDQFGLNKNDPGDNIAIGEGGYNNIEHYLNNTIPVNETGPVVYIAAYDSRADETSQESGEFKVYRTGSTSSALVVEYKVSGSASEGIDYQKLTGSVEIPAGELQAPVTIIPIADVDQSEGNEQVIVSLTASDSYFIGCPSTSLVVILDAIETGPTSERILSDDYPEGFYFFRNYPNPFNQETTFRFSLPETARVSLVIYDFTGRELDRIIDEQLFPGDHSYPWDGISHTGEVLTGGIYFARLESRNYSKTIKLLLIK